MIPFLYPFSPFLFIWVFLLFRFCDRCIWVNLLLWCFAMSKRRHNQCFVVAISVHLSIVLYCIFISVLHFIVLYFHHQSGCSFCVFSLFLLYLFTYSTQIYLMIFDTYVLSFHFSLFLFLLLDNRSKQFSVMQSGSNNNTVCAWSAYCLTCGLMTTTLCSLC